MTDTQKRIKALKKQLPSVKGKVVAMATSLLLAVVMLTSVSFAWVTLSQAPEVGGVNTTVTANGNLEIALSDFDGLEPDSSGISDSFAAQGQTTHAANTSWGNLINLSSGYGIDNLILRPASLDTQASALLSGVKYGEDGRVEGAATDFAFTTWKVIDTLNGTYGFGVPTEAAYGVRAISSVGYPDGKSVMQEMVGELTIRVTESRQSYDRITKDEENKYHGVIAGIVQQYLDDNIQAVVSSVIGGSGELVDSNCTAYKDDLYAMLNDFYGLVVIKYGEALAYMANMQHYFYTKGNTVAEYTWESLIAASETTLKAHGVNLGNTLKYFIDLEDITRKDLAQLAVYADKNYQETVYWSDLEPIINNMIDINSVTVNGKTANDLRRDKSGAISFVQGLPEKGSGYVNIVVSKGTLKKYEQLSGARMAMEIPFKIQAAVIINKKCVGIMKTDLTADDASLFSKDQTVTEKMGNSTEQLGNAVAQDTYGMVIDLWFRTNAGDSEGNGTLLTLDGTPKITTYQKQRMIVPSGESVAKPVYVYKCPTGMELEGEPLYDEVLVYKSAGDANGDGTVAEDEFIFYNCSTYMPAYVVDPETLDETNILLEEEAHDLQPKMDTYESVTGFESSNRIWNDNEILLDKNTDVSATQGSGSCYVFYADSPDAYANAIGLLSHMKLAFVDSNKNVLAHAILDVDHVYGQSGKYTVPIAIISSNYSIQNGNEVIYGVTNLQKNVAQRISVVVYLEGEGLENSMVMSKDSIQGSLNLQFSTTEDLRSMVDTELSLDTISLKANMDETSFAYGANGVTKFTPELTAIVEGLSPNSVQAVFQRRINATQGTRTTPVDLELESGSVWKGNCNFTSPGTYVLNSLLVDGVEYALPEGEVITVTVTGLSVEAVRFCSAKGEELEFTADNTVKRDIGITFAAESKYLPTEVEARLEAEDGTLVPVVLRQKGEEWVGEATFTSSGVYTLRYLIVDGEYTELDEDFQNSFTAYLGLTTSISLYREGGLTFIYEEPADGKSWPVVEIYAKIFTDKGEELKGLEGVSLNYLKRGSSLRENGLTADLKWDGTNYYGEFGVNKSGLFYFNELQIGTDNTVTNAIKAATISARSVTPLKYTGSALSKGIGSAHVTGTFVALAAASDPAYYAITLENVDALEALKAVFKYKTGVDAQGNPTYYTFEPVDYVDAVGNTFYFLLPQYNSNGVLLRNGEWVVDAIMVSGAYDDNGFYYGTYPAETDELKGEFLTIYPTVGVNKDPYTFTVMDQFEADLNKSPSVTVSGGSFMSAQNLYTMDGNNVYNGIKVLIDESKLGGLTVSNVTLTLQYTGNSATHGGYSFGDEQYTAVMTTAGLSLDGKKTISLQKISDGVWGVQNTETIVLAGTYSATMMYTLSDGTVINGGTNANLLTVQSATPSATITNISPTNSNPTSITYTTSSVSFLQGGGTRPTFTASTPLPSSFDSNKNQAILYAVATVDNSTQCHGSFTQPTLTITIAGVNSDCAVSLTLPGGSSSEIEFARTGNGEITKTLGTVSQIRTWTSNIVLKHTLNAYYGHGEQTIRTMTVTMDDVMYTVTLEKPIDINNPSSVNQQ